MRTENTARNGIFGLIRTFFQIIFKFVLRIFVIKYLGEEYLGLDSLFSSVLQILSLAELGFGSAMIFAMYKPVADQDTEKVAILLKFYKKVYYIVGISILIVGLAITPFLMTFIKDGEVPNGVNIYTVFIVYLLNTVAGYFFSYKRSLIYANQRNDIESKIGTLFIIILNGFQILILILFKNYYLYIALLPICTILENIIIHLVADKYFKLPKVTKKLESEEKKEITKNVKAMMLHKIGTVIVFSTDSLIISSFIGLTISGRYSNYYMVVSAILSLLSVFSKSFTASLGDSIVKESVEKNYKNFKMLTIMNFFILVVACSVLVVSFQKFIVFWLGKEDFLLDFYIVILIITSFFVNGSRSIIGAFRETTGTFYNDRYKPILESVVNLVVSLILVNYIGLAGVIIGTIFSSFFVALPIEMYVIFKNYFRKSPLQYILLWLKYIVVMVLGSLLCFYICSIIDLVGFWGVLVNALIACGITAVMFILSSLYDKDFRNLLMIMKNLLLKILRIQKS